MVAHRDYYLTVLPLTGETAKHFDAWVNVIVDGEQAATLMWDGPELLGAGYEFSRPLKAVGFDEAGQAQALDWTERVLVTHARELAHAHATHLEQRLTAATRALYALTPAPGKGKRQIRDATKLEQAIQQTLAQHRGVGLLTVEWITETKSVTRQRKRGRPGADSVPLTEERVRYVIQTVQRQETAITAQRDRLGWRAQVTNLPAERMSLTQAVLHYRGGWVLERDFHLVKDLPLGLSPLFVWRDDQIKGLTRLLTLALRLLTLIETQVRQGLRQEQQTLRGLYPGQAPRPTERPSGKRILQAFSRAQITVTHFVLDTQVQWHLTGLSDLHHQILRYLKLSATLYTALINNSG